MQRIHVPSCGPAGGDFSHAMNAPDVTATAKGTCRQVTRSCMNVLMESWINPPQIRSPLALLDLILADAISSFFANFLLAFTFDCRL